MSSASSASTLYDDDGQSLDYRDGLDAKTAWIRMRWNDRASQLILEPDPRMKQWPGGVRVFNVEVAGRSAPPKRIEFRGVRVSVNL